MVFAAFFQWWYGPGWRDAARRLTARIRRVYLDFSVPILLHTLFAPWRRVVSPGGGSLDQRLKAVLDNLVSRFVGLGVRLGALLVASLLIGLTALLGGLALVLWPVAPLLGIALLVWGFI
ncbi:MAG TPA: hypothetical protein VLF67_03690 [Candidatus Saccharimonas sp.]|nr:hypothetical protein [Candidatus Saccharimonas sp.]